MDEKFLNSLVEEWIRSFVDKRIALSKEYIERATQEMIDSKIRDIIFEELNKRNKVKISDEIILEAIKHQLDLEATYGRYQFSLSKIGENIWYGIRDWVSSFIQKNFSDLSQTEMEEVKEKTKKVPESLISRVVSFFYKKDESK